MVMAQQFPNTQYVAHEFVRQYYTMLHKDPSQLHRFYTKESRLTHGGEPSTKMETPVVGQEAIHEKISQLNFRNCYAKIRSVDSHPTIGCGVVIQVTGELSNSGMPMRKFMQTFVLAQQDLKKYNVYNDIFRYQDEYFDDTEENEEIIEEAAESEAYNDEAIEDHTNHNRKEEEYKEDEPILEAQYNSYHQKFQQMKLRAHEEEEQQDEEEPFQDTSEEDDEIYDSSKEDTTPSEDVDDVGYEPAEVVTPYVEPTEIEHEEQPPKEEYSEPEVVPEEEDVVIVEPAEQPTPEAEGPPKPFTWAALAKKNTPTTSVPSPAVASQTVAKKAPPNDQQQPKSQPKKREDTPPRREFPDEPNRRRQGQGAPDTHQIFIGNLPVSITEQEIREVFKEFGGIVEIRLNPKNFGFIAFDSPDAPNKILNKTKAIVINSNTINIEEKRSGAPRRGGGSGGDRRGGDRDSYRGRGGYRGGDRDSHRGGGGGSRGGGPRGGSYGQKRNTDDSRNENKNKEQSAPREQRPARR